MLNNFSSVRSVSFSIFFTFHSRFLQRMPSRRAIDYRKRDFIVAFGRSRQRQGGGQQREALCRCVADNKRGSATGGLLNRSCRSRNTSFLPGKFSTIPWALATLISQHLEGIRKGLDPLKPDWNIFIRNTNAVASYFQPCARTYVHAKLAREWSFQLVKIHPVIFHHCNINLPDNFRCQYTIRVCLIIVTIAF